MPIKYAGGAEKPLLKKRVELTKRGYPELARTAKDYTDVEQAIKTKKKLDEFKEVENSHDSPNTKEFLRPREWSGRYVGVK
jgi:hypothetical protein